MAEEKAHATLEVSFGLEEGEESSDSSPSISMELDDEANEGRTQFPFGTAAHIRIFVKPANLSITRMESNIGGASSGGTGTMTVKERITFSNSRSASVSKPISDSFSYKWVGSGLGSLSPSPDGENVRCSKKGFGIAEVTYRAKFIRGSVTAPGSGEPISVLCWVMEQ